jgi:polar amino acid transport system substrate-binding protein
MQIPISRRAVLGATGLVIGASSLPKTPALAQGTATAGDTLAKVKAAGKMLAGVRNDFPPIGSIDTSGKTVGFGPDLAEAFAKKLGVALDLVPTTSRTRIPLLQNGSIDCEFGITTPTVEREKTVDFSIPYVWDAVGMIIKEGASRKVADYGPPKKVATTQGSYIIDLFKQHIANPDIVLFQEYPDAVQALRNGKVDAVGVNVASSVAYVRPGSGLVMSENMVRDPWGS